jgi:hypothetical protein
MPTNLFDKLADEIVLEIIKHLHQPHDYFRSTLSPLNNEIRRISSCNRRLRRIALPHLYHTVYIPDCLTLHRLLQVILEYPTYAYLVRTLLLEWQEDAYGPPKHDSEKLFEVAKRSSLPESFIIGIQEQHPAAYPFLFLHLLRGLEVLDIDTQARTDEVFNMHLVGFIRGRLFASTLHALTLVADGEIDVHILFPLFLSSSITQIRVDWLVSWKGQSEGLYLPRDTNLASYYGTSSIEKLELRSAWALDNALKKLFRLPRCLKTFIYHEDMFRIDEVFDLDCLREAVEKLSNNLETLELRLVARSRFNGGYTPWSLTNFTCLKILRIGYPVMFRPGLITTSPISDILPPILEVLVMYPMYVSNWDYRDIWKMILTQKSPTCIPRLRLIAHFGDFGFLDPLVELANSHNVHVAQNRDDLDSRSC